jgi:hypothetical protein
LVTQLWVALASLIAFSWQAAFVLSFSVLPAIHGPHFCYLVLSVNSTVTTFYVVSLRPFLALSKIEYVESFLHQTEFTVEKISNLSLVFAIHHRQIQISTKHQAFLALTVFLFFAAVLSLSFNNRAMGVRLSEISASGEVTRPVEVFFLM